MVTIEPEDQEMLLVQNSEARCLKMKVQIIFKQEKQMLTLNFIKFQLF